MGAAAPRVNRELLFYAVALTALGLLRRVYFPTIPAVAWTMAGVLWAVAGLAMAGALSPGFRARWAGVPRWARAVALTIVAAVAVLPLGFMAGIALSTLFVMQEGLAVGVLVVQVLAVLGLTVAALFGRVRWPVARLAAVGLAVFNALLQVGLTAILWHPPSADVCEPPAQHPAVQRLTPQSLTDGRSLPYDVVWLPEPGLVAASFKMAGNLTLQFWDDPAANELVVIRPSNGDAGGTPEVARFAFNEPLMPEYMAYDPKRGRLAVSMLGFGEHRIDVFDLRGFPELKRIAQVPIAWEPHALVFDADQDLWVAFGAEQAMNYLDPETFEQRARTQLHGAGGGFVHFVRPSATPGTVLVSNFSRMLLTVDLVTGKTRHAQVTFGGGDILDAVDEGLILQADPFFSAINVVNKRRMRQSKRIPLDYNPRPMLLHPERRILMVGDWLGGTIRWLRLRDATEIAPKVPVGPYLRNLAYDPASQQLFAASKCGIYAVDTSATLAGN